MPVHPHGRGELTRRFLTSANRVGSSPRAWGTRAAKTAIMAIGRFIPTGVGNSRALFRVRPSAPVHPHGRGELSAWTPKTATRKGSSPRAWGTPNGLFQAALWWRFIPTGVGNSTGAMISAVTTAVHPHGRGELSDRSAASSGLVGSSPRAWGTRAHRPHAGVGQRFIPTGVGNSQEQKEPALRRAVHPHGRGELVQFPASGFPAAGSSPRAWGTHRPMAGMVPGQRFIPTGVGNSFPATLRRSHRAVHPHGRGELVAEIDWQIEQHGSSPRAWGTPSSC